nr:VP1 [Kadipiro virus]
MLDLEFENCLIDDLKTIDKWEKQQLSVYDELYGSEASDFILGEGKPPDTYRTNVFKITESGDKVFLGTLINKLFKPSIDLSRIKDERLLRCVEYDNGWYQLCVKIQQAIDNGLEIERADLPKYDAKFEYNIKHPTSENGFLNYYVLKECSVEIYMKDDNGIPDPAILRGWDISTIPESVQLPSGVTFNIRKACMRRINDEAPFYLYTSIFQYAATRIDMDDPYTRIWLKYFIGAEDFFSYNGRVIECDKSLLAHKRFEMMITAQRAAMKYDMVENSTFKECTLEAFENIIRDPIYNSYRLRGAFGDLNQHVFAKTESPSLNISMVGVESTSFRMREGTGITDSDSRINLIDGESFETSLQTLRDYGLNKNADLLQRAVRFPINRVNCKLGFLNRMVLGLCGYTGSHGNSAVVKQFTGTRDMGPTVTKEFYDEVVNEVFLTYKSALQMGDFVEPQYRLDVLMKGGTSSASSTFNHHKIKARIRYNSPFFTDEDLDSKSDKVVKTVDGKYRIITEVATTLKSKSATILTHPEDFIYSSDDMLKYRVKMGSRLVRGTRDKRIITPNYGSTYFSMLLSSLSAVRLLSSRIPNMPALSVSGRIGTTYEGALPHVVMAPMMAALSGSTKYAAVALDFSQYDSSLHGDISKAHAEGLRRYASLYPRDSNYDDAEVVDLTKVSPNKFCDITAKNYETPLEYESMGIVAEAAGVKSGELTTQLRNTDPNKAHTTLTFRRYNAKYTRKMDLIHENIVGDDKYIILVMTDGKPVTELDLKRFIDCAVDVAAENHLVISGKRSVAGNIKGEHIKIWVIKGYITQDVFLDSLVSEKNSFREMKYVDKLTTIYDIFMSMLTRFATTGPLMELFIRDIILIEGVKMGYLNFIPTVKLISAIGGPEMCPSAPELRGMARYMHDYDKDKFDTINRLFATLRERNGTEAFRRQILRQVREDEILRNEPLVSPLWRIHFKRRNGIIVDNDLVADTFNDIKKFMPEYVDMKLTEDLISTLKEPVAGRMDDNVMLTNLFTLGKLGKYDKPKFKYKFYLTEYKTTGVESPYLGACEGVRMVHKIVGLADANVKILNPAARLSALLRSRPGTHPAYLSGEDIFGILSSRVNAQQTWVTILELLDFSASVIPDVIDFCSKNMHRYLTDKNVNLTAIFDNTSRTYDVSAEMIKQRVKISGSERAGMVLTRGLGLEGMKYVLYMARRGRSVKASTTPTAVGNLTIIDDD